MSVAITIKDLQGRPLYTTEIPLNRDDRSRSPVRDDNQLRVHHDNAFPPRAMEQPSDPDSLVIGVGRPGRVEYHFTIKKNAPLRRLVNMYAGFEHRDVKLFELHWQGECIGMGNDDTAEKYGITHGTELTIVASAFMYSGNLLREYAAVKEYEPEITSEIKSESVGDAAERDDTQCLDMVITANEPV